MRGLRYNILLLMIALLCGSCEMNELQDLGTDHSEPMEIKLEVGAALAELISEGLVPDEITYQFFAKSKYAVSTTQTVKYGSDESVKVTPGTYDVLCYTSDFYDVDALSYPTQMTQLSDFNVKVVAREEAKYTSRAERFYQMINSPDPMFYNITESLELSPNSNYELAMEPGSYKYRIKFPATDIDLLRGGSVSVYGVKTELNLYTGAYPEDVDGWQDDADYMPLEVDAANSCFYVEFYSLGFNEHSETDLELTLTSHISTSSSVLVMSQVEDLDQTKVQELYAALRAMPKGGEVTYGDKIDIMMLLNLKELGPEIVPWDDESVDMVL